MVRKNFIFLVLVIVFFALFFAAASFAADTDNSNDKPVYDGQVTTDKPSTASQTLKGSDPAQGVIIGNPVTEEEMLLNPVKKKKRVQKQEDSKGKK